MSGWEEKNPFCECFGKHLCFVRFSTKCLMCICLLLLMCGFVWSRERLAADDINLIMWNSSGLPVDDLNLLFKHSRTKTHTSWHPQRQMCVSNTKSDGSRQMERMKDRVDHLKGNIVWPRPKQTLVCLFLSRCDLISACRKRKVHSKWNASLSPLYSKSLRSQTDKILSVTNSLNTVADVTQ